MSCHENNGDRDTRARERFLLGALVRSVRVGDAVCVMGSDESNMEMKVINGKYDENRKAARLPGYRS